MLYEQTSMGYINYLLHKIEKNNLDIIVLGGQVGLIPCLFIMRKGKSALVVKSIIQTIMNFVDVLYNRIILYKIVSFILPLLLLTACAQQKMDEEDSHSSSVVTESNINPQQEILVNNLNQDILTACIDTTVSQIIETSQGGIISIDAQVDVDGVSRVSRYRYIPLPFAGESRKALLTKIFPSESWDVNEAASYNEEKDAWEIVTPKGEKWVCQIRDSRMGERIVNVERIDIALDYVGENGVSFIQPFNTPVAELMLLLEVTNLKPSEIEQIGKGIAASVTEEIEYSCNYIYICGEEGEQYAKAFFQQTLDGMPVIVWHNFSTTTLKGNALPVKIWGSFYSIEEIGLDESILTPLEAVAFMKEQIDSVQMHETQICITKISLEYLAMISSDGEMEIAPIWRFWIGNDEMERNRMCMQVFAVNAVTGELIWEKRAAFTE